MSKNPNSIPDYSNFSSAMSPDQRSYVQLYVAKTVAELIHPLIVTNKNLSEQNERLTSEIATLTSRVESYESKFREDTKYAITPGKVATLMKELGIK